MLQQTMYSFLRSELYDSKFERFAVGQTATLMAVRPGLGGITVRSAKMIDISVGSATFEVTTAFGLPQHYYLSIVGTRRRIGCAEIWRQGNRIHAHFIRQIDEEFLHEIVRYEFFTGAQKKAAGKH